MSRSSAYLSQISDARCFLGDVNRTAFEATLKSSAFLFDDLRINVTDILSNQFFFDLFSDAETASQWLSSDGGAESAILRPVLDQSESFEDAAASMERRGTILSLKKPENLTRYARDLDRVKPTFVRMERPFRPAYAEHLRHAVTSLERNPRAGVPKRDLRKTADWLDREAGAELYQSNLWRFLDGSGLHPRNRNYLKRVSDTCYYLAHGEALGVSHLSLDRDGARIVETLPTPDSALAIARGERVEKAMSKFQGSALVALSFLEVARLRQHAAFGHLRKELQKLTKGEAHLGAVVEKMDECTEPLLELATARTGQGRAVILEELKNRKEAVNRGVLIEIARSGGVVAVAAVLTFVAPSVFSLPANIALIGAGLNLASLWPKAKAAEVVSANYDLAGRYAQRLQDGTGL
jgi:hypothetical protein